jgi:dTDP-4-dehydrorhamnose reductase
MNTHLIIGASGQVGEYLMRAVVEAGFEALGAYSSHPVEGMHKVDIRRQSETETAIGQILPSVVYLPASLTNVDYCELHPAEGYAVNVIGVRHVVEAANTIGAKVVYFSSDYVFDGQAGPYREEDPVNPICEYGRQKVMAEHYVALHAQDYLIIRTTVVYGWERQGKNFIYRLLNTLQAGDTLRVPADQIGSPTYAPNLAQAAVELAASKADGLYHLVGPERASRYEFACEAAKIFGLESSLIQAVPTAELGQSAPRPLNAGMRVEKATAQLTIPLVDYRAGLRMMERLNGVS